MDLHHLKIALRFALKTKLYTFLSIAGLAVGFAGFIVAYGYINREQSYDRSNPAFEQIYLVGMEAEGKRTDKTPVHLGSMLSDQLPQIEAMGRVNRFPWEVPFNTDSEVFFVKQWLGADASVAKMFQIKLVGGQLDSAGQQQVYIRSDVAARLFPKNTEINRQWVTMGRKEDGLPLQLSGVAFQGDGFSNLEFECIGFVSDLEQAGVGEALVQTFVQVEKGTDIGQLTDDMNRLYASSAKDSLARSGQSGPSRIYLDPLKNLHLKPAHGSDTGYRIVLALGLLSSIILLLAGINFSNLMIVQAQKRSREIALKKIMGVSRASLVLQFYLEVLLQCMLAAAVAALFTGFALDASFSRTLLVQLVLAAFITSLVASIYPSLVLSGGNVALILKGLNPADNHTFFRKAVLGVQFVVAFVFISTMFVINRQMSFIRSSDPGFETEQVIFIKNLALYGSPEDFDLVRGRMKEIPGVHHVSLASSVPGGTEPAVLEIGHEGRQMRMDYLNVDFEYFETLGISLLSGRFFSSLSPADTLHSVILNETAALKLGLKEAGGQVIYHQQNPLQVVGIVADSKMLGFEQMVRPTVYSVRSLNSVPKVEIMAKLSGSNIKRTLDELEARWHTINQRDGDHFIYDFADEKFALLNARQEDLNKAVSGFTLLIVTVAFLGLFSMAAFSIQLRQKEVGIRKVLGASWHEILLTLNSPFIRIVGLAMLAGAPVAWWLTDNWLRSFAYKIELEWWYFVLCALLALLLAFFMVSIQTIKTIVMKPVHSLRQD